MTLAYNYQDQAVPFELRDGAVFWVESIDPTVPVPCLWAAKCERTAVTSLAHPILGHVPCCQRCADLAEAHRG